MAHAYRGDWRELVASDGGSGRTWISRLAAKFRTHEMCDQLGIMERPVRDGLISEATRQFDRGLVH